MGDPTLSHGLARRVAELSRRLDAAGIPASRETAPVPVHQPDSPVVVALVDAGLPRRDADWAASVAFDKWEWGCEVGYHTPRYGPGVACPAVPVVVAVRVNGDAKRRLLVRCLCTGHATALARTAPVRTARGRHWGPLPRGTWLFAPVAPAEAGRANCSLRAALR